MFGWTGRSAYRKEVLAVVGDVLIDTDGQLARAFLKQFPGAESAITSGFNDKQAKDEVAVALCQVFLGDAIDRMPDPQRRAKIACDIRAWGGSGDQRSIADYRTAVISRPVDPDMDAFDLRLRAAISTIVNLAHQNRIAVDSMERFVGEIMGALDGIPRDERERRRYIDIIHQTLAPKMSVGEADTSAPMPPTYAASEPEECSGTDVEVTIEPTVAGLALRRKDNGQIITERRRLTQETLANVPGGAERYRFANFEAKSGEIYSCIFVGPTNDVYGDMRAFWWSLARAIVATTEARANGTQMSQHAYATVCGNARGMWASAIQQTSIEDMRDLIMPLRNVHFEVMNKSIDQAKSDPEKLGIEITLAMVMAIQSEDELLEGHAYRRLRRFLWLPGEEPREFWKHDRIQKSMDA